MRLVGKRIIRPIAQHASGSLLKQGAEMNDELHRLPTGDTTKFVKGIYRYSSHEEANRHWMSAVVNGIVLRSGK